MAFTEFTKLKNQDPPLNNELVILSVVNPLAGAILEQLEYMQLHNPTENDLYECLLGILPAEIEDLKNQGEEISYQQIESVETILKKYLAK